MSSLDKASQSRQVKALQKLKESLEKFSGDKVNLDEVRSLLPDLPESIRKSLEEYLDLFAEPVKPEESKASLSQEELKAIFDSREEEPLGSGSFGIVYSSADGKYALKVPNFDQADAEGDPNEAIAEDIEKNEALNRNAEAFDPNQFYCQQKDNFITRYVGTFKTTFETRTDVNVAVFERIDGVNFFEYNADTPSKQITLLAQAATALAISHEAGCINSDVKPENMMVTKDASLLKLIDQGSVIDLVHAEKLKYEICTPNYVAPEAFTSLLLNLESLVTPACDVYSMGVSILEKLESITTKEENRNEIEKIIGDLAEDSLNFDSLIFPNRNELSEKIADWCGAVEIIPEDKEGSEFIGCLLRDCLAYKPKDRISVAQLAEILQVFSSYLRSQRNRF